MKADEVQNRIAQVFGARNKAVADLLAQGDSFAKDAVNGIRAMKLVFEDWRQRGFDALAVAGGKGVPPGPNGWQGWINKGQFLLDQLAEMSKSGKSARLEALKEVAKDAPATSAKFAKAVAVDVAKATGQAVGDISTGLISPLLKPLGMVALVAGGFLILFAAGKSQLKG